MAIRNTGFTNLGNTGLRKTLELLISKQSEKIILIQKDRILEKLREVAVAWRKLVREELSKPVQKRGDGSYIRNTDLWPRMEEGRLVRAINTPQTGVFYRENERSLRKNQMRFKVTNFYSSYIQTVGVELDEMTDTGGKKPFAGWLVRANRHWDTLMKERLK